MTLAPARPDEAVVSSMFSDGCSSTQVSVLEISFSSSLTLSTTTN
jgi:hypothetical protein